MDIFSDMATPHPGLVLAVNAAGSRRQLAKMCGLTHGTINYYWRTGRPLSATTAAKVGRIMGIRGSLLMDKGADNK